MIKTAAVFLLVSILGFFAVTSELEKKKTAWTNAGIEKGRAEIQKKWDAETVTRERAEKLAIANRLLENEAAKARFAAEKSQMKEGYEKQIINLRAMSAASGSLRISPGVCAGFASGAEAYGPSRGDEASTASRVLPEPYSGNIKQLMLEAEEFLASCRVAQNFITKYGFAP